jgi:hypothetical protein
VASPSASRSTVTTLDQLLEAAQQV